MNTTAYEHFLAAFERLLAEKGRGAQRRIAEAINKTPMRLNDILKGRSRASQSVQEAIARFFGLTYDEMLALGRGIVESRATRRSLPFHEELDRHREGTRERYLLIYEKICQQLGLPEMYPFISRIVDAAPVEFHAYQAAEVDDYEVFHSGKGRVTRIQNCALKEFRRRKRAQKR